ncbi:MAG: transglutaminase-like domain-containing protein [Planctomycetota bacterium]
MLKPQNYINAFIALLLILAPAIQAQDKPVIEPYEAWFVMNIGGQKAGHMHVTLKQDGDKIVNTTAMKIEIARGAAPMTIEQSSSFIETLDHQPVKATSSMTMSTLATTQRLDFTGEKWKMTTTAVGQSNTIEMDPAENDWLTPGALSAFMLAALERGDEEITVRTLDLSTGAKPIEMTMKRGEQADIEVFGRVVPATKWTTTMSALPGIEVIQWSDDAGQPVRQVIPMLPGMEMEMLLADKELALADFDAPELLAASFIKPDKPIKNPRKLKRAVFDIVADDLKKNIGDVIPNAGAQRTKWIDDNTLRITIDLDNPVEAEDRINLWQPTDDYIASATMLNYMDKAVADLVKDAVDLDALKAASQNRSPDPFAEATWQAAGKLRDYVREHIDAKDLSVGFASASETARTGQGDCTEHACLLAAMLRGAGIQSRTVTGLVYADQFAGERGIFGFHMWTQAGLINPDGTGIWYDLDAAMPGEISGFDATHIALSTSAMKDGDSFNDMVQLLPLMQGMEIKVIETQWAN